MSTKRTITLSLDKAKEWYKQGGELKEIALQAYDKNELTNFNPSLDFCEFSNPTTVDNQISSFAKLKYYISYYNGENFNHCNQKGYYPRIWWYKEISTMLSNRKKYVGYVITRDNTKLYVSVGSPSSDGLLSGLFSYNSSRIFSYSDASGGAYNILACKTEELRDFVENHFAKEIIESFYGQWIKEYHINQ